MQIEERLRADIVEGGVIRPADVVTSDVPANH